MPKLHNTFILKHHIMIKTTKYQNTYILHLSTFNLGIFERKKEIIFLSEQNLAQSIQWYR